MKFFNYYFQVKHDLGVSKLRFVANSKKRAIQMLQRIEGCPLSAIKRIDRSPLNKPKQKTKLLNPVIKF